ncbi:MAG: lipoate--protein ligase [Firmicutes bacterium]|nr:lipoate--protein ligase [Bacillota bacterium]
MIYVNYPDNEIRRLSFYLATEEYLATHYSEDEYFFMWQVNPTVIFGRNQLIENEVNLEYVRSHNIQYYRRKSGGGCVYADFSNIMFSFITPTFQKDFVFDTYLNRIVSALNSLGLDTHFSGRNDILIGEQKISGNAFYRIGNRSCVHGTMLYDTDLSVMVKAITPDNEKLISKGIDSVRKRVTNLKEHFDLDIETFKSEMKKRLCDSEITLTKQDLIGIARIEDTYLDPSFIYGKNPGYTLIKKGRLSVGQMEIRMELKNNIVKKMNMLGDYFLVGDTDILLDHFTNIDFSRDSFSVILKNINLKDFVYNLEESEFLDLLFERI